MLAQVSTRTFRFCFNSFLSTSKYAGICRVSRFIIMAIIKKFYLKRVYRSDAISTEVEAWWICACNTDTFHFFHWSWTSFTIFHYSFFFIDFVLVVWNAPILEYLKEPFSQIRTFAPALSFPPPTPPFFASFLSAPSCAFRRRLCSSPSKKTTKNTEIWRIEKQWNHNIELQATHLNSNQNLPQIVTSHFFNLQKRTFFESEESPWKIFQWGADSGHSPLVFVFNLFRFLRDESPTIQRTVDLNNLDWRLVQPKVTFARLSRKTAAVIMFSHKPPKL